ncbi:MAG TPA: SDR family oxidoreductase [Pyrinomonadaceae bacterium]|nr:SDR family oxidoreductase [Pyrinomonadaceae bacterium]
MSLKGKHALITGSSRGIGRGIALKLAEHGVKIAINYYQNEAAASDTLARVRERGSDGFLIQADVSRPDNIKQMFQRVRDEFGKLDIFVSNARSEVPTFYLSPMEIGLEQWDMAMDSQAKAFLLGVQESAPLMIDGGRIIAITYSTGSRTGSWQPWVAMGAAKAAVESLVRYFAVALAKRGITVNALSPGFTEDSVLNSLPPEAQEMVRSWHKDWTPMGRLGTPTDIGKIVGSMCSEEAGWITGQVIYTDGGASIMNPELPPAIQRG